MVIRASVQILLKDIHQLERNLSQFEQKFGVESQDFYAAMMARELEEFDSLDNYAKNNTSRASLIKPIILKCFRYFRYSTPHQRVG